MKNLQTNVNPHFRDLHSFIINFTQSEPEKPAHIDLSAIKSNYTKIRKVCQVPVMCVLKADAYGHGLVPVALALQSAGAETFCVADLAEADTLRKAGVSAEIIVWQLYFGSVFSKRDPLSESAISAFKSVLFNRTVLAVSCLSHLNALEHLYKVAHAEPDPHASINPLQIHIKIDTGFHRNGVQLFHLPRMLQKVRELEDAGVVKLCGIMTHLAQSVHDREQHMQFLQAVEIAKDFGFINLIKHIAATHSAIDCPDMRHSAVRCGIGLFGLGELRAVLGLKQAYLDIDITEIARVYNTIDYEVVTRLGAAIMQTKGRKYTFLEDRPADSTPANYTPNCTPKLIPASYAPANHTSANHTSANPNLAISAQNCPHVTSAQMEPISVPFSAQVNPLGVPIRRLQYTCRSFADALKDYGKKSIHIRLISSLIHIKNIKKGQWVGYGAQYYADSDTHLGLVPIGYADAIPRIAFNPGSPATAPLSAPTDSPANAATNPHPTTALNLAGVYVAGRFAPLVGAVSMDQIVVDLGKDLNISKETGKHYSELDSVVTIFDTKNPHISLEKWALWCRTDPLSFLFCIGPRVIKEQVEGWE